MKPSKPPKWWLTLALLVGAFHTWASPETPLPAGVPAIAKTSVDAVCANVFTLQNVVVELIDIDHIQSTEVSEGLFQLTILNKENGPCLQAILPFKWATLAEHSKTLVVSVKDPKHVPPKLTIYGNAIIPDGLSNPPKVIWVVTSG